MTRYRTLPDGREILSGAAWQRRRKEVWERDGRKCVICNRGLPALRDAETDHIVKRSKARDDRPQNLRSLCRGCHWNRHEEERRI
jgi:5-methylcytosine-specific restriction endonuclease McrA